MKRARGFTLLEVLMAVTLLALLLAGAYSGIQTSVRAMHAGERVIERVDRVRTVQEFEFDIQIKVVESDVEKFLDARSGLSDRVLLFVHFSYT